ncbi:hypothetical protein [Halobacillus karajensis]|uniref:hypothetical protein n=1 Tax=Halobacillus karajensis TaxID=195088 RepID=UPI00045C6577|nr:hypothetical protein [Halobacillus karajensis]CDQ17956.1 hypothetical protein BN982_00196 [Halobacillus karajensis]
MGISTVYFAKFNINEKIYDVYEGKESLNKLLESIYNGINTDTELKENVKKKDINYKFITLDKKDQMVISGRLVAYAPGTHVSYDDEKDDVVETKDNKKATYVTFTFDVRREIIGFVPKFDFGYKQFIDRFANLVEEMVKEVGEVELVLEQDRQKLQKRLDQFHIVKDMRVDLVPPNNDKKLFKRLYGLDPEDINETGGTRFMMQFKGTAKKGIDLASSFAKNLILGVTIGYGRMIVEGENRSHEPYRVKSDKDALFTRPINSHNKENINAIEEKTRSGITILMAEKQKATSQENVGSKLKEKLIQELENEQREEENVNSKGKELDSE